MTATVFSLIAGFMELQERLSCHDPSRVQAGDFYRPCPGEKCACGRQRCSTPNDNTQYTGEPYLPGTTDPTPVTSVPGKPFRDIPVDLIRGLAIVLMVAANTVPALLSLPAPFLLRLLATLAAPLFITLSGMMVALSWTKKKHDLGYFFIRGGLVILTGAALEVLTTGKVPFLSMDVLYLIGLSLPLTYLFLACRAGIRRAMIPAIFCLGPVLWAVFSYPALPLTSTFAALFGAGTGLSSGAVAMSWIVTGWFPVIPWIAFAFLGAELGMVRWQQDTIRPFTTPAIGTLALGCLAAGATLWALYPGPHVVRFGYIELFYPAVPGFCICMTGFIVALFIAADLLPKTRLLSPLRAMGECSLAIYILHSLIIAWFIQPQGILLPAPAFLLCAGIFVLGMAAFACLVRRLRPLLSGRSGAIRFLIGG